MTDNHKGEKHPVVVWHEGKPQCKKKDVLRGNLHASTAVSGKEKSRVVVSHPSCFKGHIHLA